MALKATLDIWDRTETFDSATTNYKTFNTSIISSAKIPKYSTIIDTYLGLALKTNVSLTKASLKVAFSNRSGSNGSPNGTVVKDFGKVIGSEQYMAEVELTPYIHSNDANAGKYNGDYPYLLYWSEGTYRKWTLYNARLMWSYIKPTYQIIASSADSVKGSVEGSGTWDVEIADFTKTITAVPKTHYHFVSWNDGNTDISRTFTISQNNISSHETTKTYIATFAPDTYNILVVSNGNGTVTGSGSYEYGTSITITAVPNAGYRFKSWNDGNADATREVTVSGATTYTATFEKTQYTLKDVSEHGYM